MTLTFVLFTAGSFILVGLFESVDNWYVTPSTMILIDVGPEVDPFDCMKLVFVSG